MTASGAVLGSSGAPLCQAYDVAMLDLDGVVYVGPEAVPGVPEHLAAARQRGMALAFVTNNASRPPDAVAAHLTDLGVPACPDDVVTAAQAAARLLSAELVEGSPVFVIGGEGLFVALQERGLRPVQSADDEPVAVVSGYHPDLRWGTVIDGAILVRDGLPWVASNTDATVPTPRGPGPGNGVLVRAVAEFSGRIPTVAGKPEPPLLRETQRRVGGERPLVVGDRLDTDIEGAARAGYDSLLVMTGVTDLETLAGVERQHRPTYLSATLSGLLEEQHAPGRDGDVWQQGAARARLEGERVTVETDGSADASASGWWQVLASAAWAHLDDTGRPADVSGLAPPQPSDGATAR